MEILFRPLNPFNFPDLFTLLWVAALVILVGATAVYVAAGKRYRRYPAILALHEWLFWAAVVSWGLVPLLVVIGVPLVLVLLLVIPGMGVMLWARFVKFPPVIAAQNDELRKRRYVPPPRSEGRGRKTPTPAGGHRSHRR